MTTRVNAPRNARHTFRPATERQFATLKSMAEDRVPGQSEMRRLAEARADWRNLSTAAVSDLITMMSKCPRRDSAPAPVQAQSRQDFSQIPQSNYCLENADGEPEFFAVTVGKTGRWEGFRFVEKLIGAPGDWRRVKFRGAQSAAVLSKIATDTYTDRHPASLQLDYTGPKAAAIRYSRMHECCARCNSPLSDPESLARGLGPVCAGKY